MSKRGHKQGTQKEGGEAVREVENLKKDLDRFVPDLIINKVPKGELKLFKEIAYKEFNGDYGICMKFLVNYFINDAKYTYLFDKVHELENELMGEQSETREVKLMDGTTIQTTR